MSPLCLFALVISIVKINLIVKETNIVLKLKISTWEFFKGSGKNRITLEIQRDQQKDSQIVEET